MLQSISTDGFKSLNGFKFKIREGLNIFIGPNGSGKTNIVSLFEFLSYLMDDPVSEAIIRAGGVNSVFRKYSDQTMQSSIRVSVEGEYSFVRSFSGAGTRRRMAQYHFEFQISRSSEAGLIFFSNQSFKFRVTTAARKFRRYKSGKPVWDLIIHSSVKDTLHAAIQIERFDIKKMRPPAYPSGISRETMERMLRLRIERADPSIFALIQILEPTVPDIRHAKIDLSSGRAYNIIPNVVKSREEAVSPPGVQSDGSGTSSTLFTLWKAAHRGANIPRPQRIYQGGATSRALQLSQRTYDEVLDLLRLVNTSISDLRIFVDPYENFLRVLFSIETPEGLLEVPLQNMSDGTAKWLALTIAILSNRGVFAIEEPENFLHPYMQKEILQIIRDSMGDYGRRGFAVITTHSETLLNAARPEELVIVKMDGGSTITSRVSDPKLIDEEMKRSGFGLGYLYLTGVLNYA